MTTPWVIGTARVLDPMGGIPPNAGTKGWAQLLNEFFARPHLLTLGLIR